MLLRSCAELHVIATSRELLGIEGEAVWRVAPLSLPNANDGTGRISEPAARVLASESGRLFQDRARLPMPVFSIKHDNALAVVQICQRLDGIPLAIELAAARQCADSRPDCQSPR